MTSYSLYEIALVLWFIVSRFALISAVIYVVDKVVEKHFRKRRAHREGMR